MLMYTVEQFQIISNKKCIQKGRTQTINKLVQKIRKLKLQLDKQSENDRTRSRLRKATETMSHLKVQYDLIFDKMGFKILCIRNNL